MRPRLDTTDALYLAVDQVVRLLEAGGEPLWAANLRSCLHEEGSREVLAGLQLEVHRLRSARVARRLALEARLEEIAATLTHAVGEPDTTCLPLYVAMRDLLDLLRTAGAQPAVESLEAAAHGDGLHRPSADDRVAAVDRALDALVRPGAPSAGLPAGSSARAQAVRSRLRGGRQAQHTVDCLLDALRPPVAGLAHGPGSLAG
jgi:hypothetical protein